MHGSCSKRLLGHMKSAHAWLFGEACGMYGVDWRMGGSKADLPGVPLQRQRIRRQGLGLRQAPLCPWERGCTALLQTIPQFVIAAARSPSLSLSRSLSLSHGIQGASLPATDWHSSVIKRALMSVRSHKTCTYGGRGAHVAGAGPSSPQSLALSRGSLRALRSL